VKGLCGFSGRLGGGGTKRGPPKKNTRPGFFRRKTKNKKNPQFLFWFSHICFLFAKNPATGVVVFGGGGGTLLFFWGGEKRRVTTPGGTGGGGGGGGAKKIGGARKIPGAGTRTKAGGDGRGKRLRHKVQRFIYRGIK